MGEWRAREGRGRRQEEGEGGGGREQGKLINSADQQVATSLCVARLISVWATIFTGCPGTGTLAENLRRYFSLSKTYLCSALNARRD